jgi:hypothetical protein
MAETPKLVSSMGKAELGLLGLGIVAVLFEDVCGKEPENPIC